MFKFMRRYAVVFDHPDMTGIADFYFFRDNAEAAAAMCNLIALTKPKLRGGDYSVVKTDKILRSKGTIGQGWIARG